MKNYRKSSNDSAILSPDYTAMFYFYTIFNYHEQLESKELPWLSKSESHLTLSKFQSNEILEQSSTKNEEVGNQKWFENKSEQEWR